jgi:hypothetical protein
MPVRYRSGLWLAVLISLASSVFAESSLRLDPDPAWRKASGILELTEILDTWLDRNTDFQRPEIPPKITLISPATAATIRGSPLQDHGRTRGLFDPRSSTIFLIQPWDPKTANDVSILLHELVHSRQVSHYYLCPGAEEELAYRIQDDWLRARGLRANVNWFAVVLEAGCSRRDIHPD